MADGYQVHLEALQQHKGDVQDIAAGVHTAAQAAEQGQALGDDSFGIVGLPFAMVMQGFTGTASMFIGLVAGAADDIADRLGSAHDAYRDHEKQTVGTVDGLGKELPA
ncbi:type VII secretion target [Amycolatopsis sp. Poz14]|uniref:type VII secretion target n=1 Tax=Amycolatopsis sp. Poz14 TaxID=1447705 RepID=UPI001EE81D3B|nr:type VII secretion target [Amycolatopsis sp. Poz14]MCG3752439.1 hypothetical protein [Amycolatopsis sp. Poz14]